MKMVAKSVAVFVAVFVVVLALDFLWWGATQHLPSVLTEGYPGLASLFLPWGLIGLGVVAPGWRRDPSLLPALTLGAIAGTATAFILIIAHVLMGI